MSKRRRAFPSFSIGLSLVLGLASCVPGSESRPVDTPSAPTVERSPAARPSNEVPRRDDDRPVLLANVLEVTDGDTIKVLLKSGPITVRFASIDAPEMSQPWGREAYAALYQLVHRQVVALEVMKQDRYERLVAVVYLGDQNLNGWLVQQGHAWAYRQYLDDTDYCIWEASARAGKRGLWSLPAKSRYAPWEWRRVQRGDAGGFTDYSNETSERCIAAMRRSRPHADATARLTPTLPIVPPSARCLVKGNIGQNVRIYHVPGSLSYDSTRVDESKGERWFRSVTEAQAAEWRASP